MYISCYLLGNMSAGKGVARGGYGVTRVGEGTNKAGLDF